MHAARMKNKMDMHNLGRRNDREGDTQTMKGNFAEKSTEMVHDESSARVTLARLGKNGKHLMEG